MGLAESLVFYLLAGAGVAVAVAVMDDENRPAVREFRLITAVLFWPLYLPLLMRTRDESADDEVGTKEVHPSCDQLAKSIAQVETELFAAFDHLDGWMPERFADAGLLDLYEAWRLQAGRIREIDRVLAGLSAESAKLECGDESPAGSVNERVVEFDRLRRENIEQLRELRGRLHDDLVAALAWVRELVTMIHLAKFTGAPASRIDELVAQIASTAEMLEEPVQLADCTR